ncbi:MAG: hypothetical protein ABH883_05325 [Candidatus Omnitrophota bacterium]
MTNLLLPLKKMKLPLVSGRTKKLFIYCGIFFYVFLCGLHFFSGRELWLDEVSVLENIKELSPSAVFGPLKHSQAFPRLYLLAVQGLGSKFNYSLISLRALPFIFMIAAFFLWLRIYREEEGAGTGYMFFILSWCASHFMTYYSAELKQYSAEVFAAGVFTYFIIRQKKYLDNGAFDRFLALRYCLLPSLILISYTGYFFILLPFYNLALSVKKNRTNVLYILIYLAAAVIFVLISYNTDIKYTRSDGPLRAYWNDYFISTASISAFFQSFTEGLRNLFVRWFLETKLLRHIMTCFMPAALFAVVFYGFRQFSKDSGRALSLKTMTPYLILTLAFAGILKIFPFTGARITLYIAPFIFYALIKGIESFRAGFRSVYLIFSSVFVITLISVSIYLFNEYLRLFSL